MPFTADVWVAKAADGGDDANDGLAEFDTGSAGPKLTINAAITVANSFGGGASKRLAIKQGTYSESIGQDGSAGYPVSGTSFANAMTMIAYPGHTVIVNGASTSLGPITFYASTVGYIIIDGIIFDNRRTTDGSSIFFGNGTHHIRVQNCEAKNGTSTGGISIFDAPDCEILSCLVHNNGLSSDLDHGIYSSSHRTTVQGCTIYNNAAHGIQFYTGTTKRDDCIAEKNRIYSNGNCGIVASDLQGLSRLVNNLIFENGTAGAGVRDGIYAQNCADLVIYNNTIVGNTIWGLERNGGMTGDIVRNNIFRGNGSGDISGTPATETNNWKNADGDPLFVSLAGDDYHLTSSSGPRNNGATISSVTDDFDGVTRPQGAAYDQGAHEFVTSGTTFQKSLSSVAVASVMLTKQVTFKRTLMTTSAGVVAVVTSFIPYTAELFTGAYDLIINGVSAVFRRQP